MNIPDMYHYLVRARRDLCAALQAVPDHVLAHPSLPGSRHHCIKDLVFHIASVEDCWLHEDILRNSAVLETQPALQPALMDTDGGPAYAGFPLSTLVDYWRLVEHSTLSYLSLLTDQELARIITLHDSPLQRYTVDSILSHVMMHEIRHTAQICVLLRLANIKPPSLDLLFYLAS